MRRALLSTVSVFVTAATARADTWPIVNRVEAQPLLAQARRVEAALELLGSPLPAGSRAALERARGASGDEAVTAAVQAALDPQCAAALRIEHDGRLAVFAPKESPVLVEQGWRVVLVKVLNDAEAASMLLVESPNARDVANAPASETAKRWLDLQAYNSQPLLPSLGGLGLEYRVVQLYSRDAGDLECSLSFRLSDGGTGTGAGTAAGAGRIIRLWSFDGGADGWLAMNQVKLEAKEGVLAALSEGNDPYLGTEVKASGGEMVVRFATRCDEPSAAQVYWWTKEKPMPDGERQRSISTRASGRDFDEYSVTIPVRGELAGIRFDPSSRQGKTEIDWICLSYAGAPDAAWTTLPLKLKAEPSREVAFRVTDEHGKPTTAAFRITDARGRVYPAQGKRLEPDFFFHPQVYRADGENVRLPAGEYTVVCQRGPESMPETQRLVVGADRAAIIYQVKRWIDPAALGWWSGDHHIHAAGCLHYTNPTEGVTPASMARHILGEDLKVGSALTWGPCFDFQKRFFSGKEDAVSSYPYILRYDIEVSGFGSHQSGHLCLLNLKEQIYPGGESKNHWPTLGLNTLRWAKGQGAVTGPAHSAAGLTGAPAGRIEGTDGKDGPGGLPTFDIPPYDGIGANEYIADITHEVPGPDGKPVPAIDFISTMDTQRRAELNMWYHTLNCGFRVRASGETDFPCISGARVGMGRVYVKCDGEVTYTKWCDGIRAGRSYVSDGSAHLLELEANAAADPAHPVAVGVGASELRLEAPAVVRLKVKAAARLAGGERAKVEAVVNAYPVAEAWIPADGTLSDVALDVKVEKSSWVALRIYPSAHTNPIFVLVSGKPVRASRKSAEWCLRGVDQCWSQKQRFYDEDEKDDARKAYDHARETYRRIVAESGE